MIRTIPFNRPVILVSLTSILLAACSEKAPDIDLKSPEPVSKVSVSKVSVSKVSVSKVSVSEKKANFFAHLQPMIEQANNEVLLQREELLGIQADLPELSKAQTESLVELTKTYRVDIKLNSEQQTLLLVSKINTIPAALILAQAANESAWGTSRFAREGNNFFGQWCFSKGCGIVPNSRNEGADHEVASFDSPLDSVRSYIRNLNSHPAYQGLRDLRDLALSQGEKPSGETLAQGLIAYSERGEEYVKEIQSMIRYNKLSRFDVGSIDKPAPSISGKG
jgi:Bax protein